MGWMHWHISSIVGFSAFFSLVIGLNVWHFISPSYPRKGFLPMMTTRGERTFIGLLCFFAINLLWLAFVPETHVLWSFLISIPLIIVMVTWG